MKRDKRTDRIANIVIGGSVGLIALSVVILLAQLGPPQGPSRWSSPEAFAASAIGMFVCAYWAGKFAQRNGRSRYAWLWLGAIFGPWAVAAAYFLPASKSGKRPKSRS